MIDHEAAVGPEVEGGGGNSFRPVDGGSHFVRGVVAGAAVRVGRRGHRAGAEMFVVAGGAGVVARDVRLVKGVAGVAFLAGGVERAGVGGLERPGGTVRLVAFLAVVGEVRVRPGNRPGVVEGFRAEKIIDGHARDAAESHEQDGEEAEPPPVMRLLEIVEVALEALGDLFLRSAVEAHGQ